MKRAHSLGRQFRATRTTEEHSRRHIRRAALEALENRVLLAVHFGFVYADDTAVNFFKVQSHKDAFDFAVAQLEDRLRDQSLAAAMTSGSFTKPDALSIGLDPISGNNTSTPVANFSSRPNFSIVMNPPADVIPVIVGI